MGKKCREQSLLAQKDTRQVFRKWRLYGCVYVWLYICSLAHDCPLTSSWHSVDGLHMVLLHTSWRHWVLTALCYQDQQDYEHYQNCLKQRMMNVYISGAPSVGSSPQEEFLYKQVLSNILQCPSDLCTSAQSLANKIWTFSLKSSAQCGSDTLHSTLHYAFWIYTTKTG